MKTLKNKKGFTLIELLAVIVILGIVMVLAVTTVLPYLGNAKQKAFETEVASVKDAASKSISLIQIGSVTSGYNEKNSSVTGEIDYCFTISELKALGVISGLDNYQGYVTATHNSTSKKGFTYKVSMQNDTTAGNVTYYIDENHMNTSNEEDPIPVTAGKLTTTTAIAETCTGYTAK